MALFEFYCDTCSFKFEQITSSTDEDSGKCPKCQNKNTRKLISRFSVGGRGDLRESTMHGCHGGCHHISHKGGSLSGNDGHSHDSPPDHGGGNTDSGSGTSDSSSNESS